MGYGAEGVGAYGADADVGFGADAGAELGCVCGFVGQIEDDDVGVYCRWVDGEVW